MHTHWLVWQSVQIRLSGFVRTWSSYLSRKSGTVCVDFSSTASVLPPRRTSDCGRFELRCTEQKLPSRRRTMKQLDFCTCAFVLLPQPCHNSIAGAETSIMHAHKHQKVTGSRRRMAVPAQKNIWFASKYGNMKEEPSGLKARGHGDQGRQNLHHHPCHIGVS